MSTVKEREQEEEHRRQVQEQCTSEAATAGFKAAGAALVAAALAVGAANTYAPGFRRALGISGKTALVVSDQSPAECQLSAPVCMQGHHQQYLFTFATWSSSNLHTCSMHLHGESSRPCLTK